MRIAIVASLTEEMAAQSIAYHTHGTADGVECCCCPWLVWHDINSAMHCSLRLTPTVINHLTTVEPPKMDSPYYGNLHNADKSPRSRIIPYTIVYVHKETSVLRTPLK